MDDKQRLFEFSKGCIQKTFEDALNYIEVVLPTDQYRKVRTRILRSGNDQIRNLKKEFLKYDVKSTPLVQEEIDFKDPD